MDVEDVRGTLAPYHALLRDELEHYGGTVEKFIGDAVMALFGAPVTHEDDPERAVRAALSIRAAIDRLNEQEPGLDLHVRVGVNTGEALVVLGADAGRGEGMASGDVVNTAARLQSAAPVDGILVGETTYHATDRAITYRQSSRSSPRARPGRFRRGRRSRPARASGSTSCSGRRRRWSAAGPRSTSSLTRSAGAGPSGRCSSSRWWAFPASARAGWSGSSSRRSSASRTSSRGARAGRCPTATGSPTGRWARWSRPSPASSTPTPPTRRRPSSARPSRT